MLLLILVLTAVTVLAAPLLGRVLGCHAGWPLAGLLGTGAVALAVTPVPTTQVLPWMPTLGVDLALRLDGLSMVFALLVLGVGALVLAYCSGYLDRVRQGSFYTWMTLFALAMLALVLADDVVLLFVAWEVTTLCSFFLIARSGPSARQPAIRTLLVTAAGGLCLLAAVATMAVATGTTRLSEILTDQVWSQRPALTTTVAVLVALAAFTKSAQFPFQAWLPDAMAAITPVSAYLHAAAMVKAGIYLLLRFSGVFGQVPVWNAALITAGLITAVFGAVAALRRHDLKELLAYSTVSQLGFLVAVIGVGSTGAIYAAVAHTVAHALFKSALFLLVGVIDTQTGTRDLRELAGLHRQMPLTVAAVSVAALSMAGVPPLLGFVSKESMFAALWAAPVGNGVLFAGIAALAAAFTFAYSGRIVLGLLRPAPTRSVAASPAERSGRGPAAPAGGPRADEAGDATTGRRQRAPAGGGHGAQADRIEAPALFWCTAALPAAAGLVLGLVPFLLDSVVGAAATAVQGQPVPVHLALWHGVNAALMLSLLAIGTGALLVRYRTRVEVFLAAKDSPVSGLDVVDRWRAGTIRLGEWVGAPTASNAPARHLAVPMVMITVIAVVGVLRLEHLAPVVDDPTSALDWALVALIAGGVLGAVRAPTRIAALVVTGVVGLATTLWFFVLGAADVALTQLMVEILTVVVMVLLLRRLPLKFRPASTRRRIGAGVIALAAGTAATLGVLALTGRRGLSPAGYYYVTEGEQVTGGANVVNTILVDFRALDTLGELTVLGVAGVAIAALLRSRPPLGVRAVEQGVREDSPLRDAVDNTVFVRTLTRAAGPLIVAMSLFFLLRGHQQPGGGFIAALIGGAGFALLYLSAPSERVARVRWPYLVLIGAGVVVGAGAGLVGFVEGSFLTPLHSEVFGISLTTALVFDLGVYLAVIGVVLTSLNLLGLKDVTTTTPTSATMTTTEEVNPR